MMANKRNLGRRTLAILMALVLSLSLLQVAAFATEIENDSSTEQMTMGATQGTDTQGTDTQGADTQGTDTQGTDTQGTDTQGMDTQTTEEQPSVEITGSATAKGVMADVDAPEGAFPGGTTLEITPVTGLFHNFLGIPMSNVEDAIQDTMDDSSDLNGAVAFDITFYDVNGDEIQPADGYTVSVTFSVDDPSQALGEDVGQLQVYHMENTNSDAEPVGEPADFDPTADNNQVSVQAESFSIYVVGTTTSAVDEGHSFYLNAGDTVQLVRKNSSGTVSTGGTWTVQIKESGFPNNRNNNTSDITLTAQGSGVESAEVSASAPADSVYRVIYHSSRTTQYFYIYITSIDFSVTPETVTIDLNTATTTAQLTAVVTAGGTPVSSPTVAWTSSNTNVATVDSATGLVTGIARGTATITASYTNGPHTYTDTTAVTVNRSGVEISPAEITIGVGRTSASGLVTASVYDGTTRVSSPPIAWSSSDLSIATVNPTTGVVTGVGTGTATVTATYTPSGGAPITGSLTVHVAAVPTYTGRTGSQTILNHVDVEIANATISTTTIMRDHHGNQIGDPIISSYTGTVTGVSLVTVTLADGSVRTASNYQLETSGSQREFRASNLAFFDINDILSLTATVDITDSNHTVHQGVVVTLTAAQIVSAANNCPQKNNYHNAGLDISIDQSQIVYGSETVTADLNVTKTFAGGITSTEIGTLSDFAITVTDGSKHSCTLTLGDEASSAVQFISGTETTVTFSHSGNTYSWVFSNLPTDNYTVAESGYSTTELAAKYTITETANTVSGTSAAVDVTPYNTAAAAFVNTYTVATTSFTFDKVWAGDNAGTRPDSITVMVNGSQYTFCKPGTDPVPSGMLLATADGSNTWVCTVPGLPAGGTYSVSEATTGGNYTTTYTARGDVNIVGYDRITTCAPLSFPNVRGSYIVIMEQGNYYAWTSGTVDQATFLAKLNEVADGPFKNMSTPSFLTTEQMVDHGVKIDNGSVTFDSKATWSQFCYGGWTMPTVYTVTNTIRTIPTTSTLTVTKSITSDDSFATSSSTVPFTLYQMDQSGQYLEYAGTYTNTVAVGSPATLTLPFGTYEVVENTSSVPTISGYSWVAADSTTTVAGLVLSDGGNAQAELVNHYRAVTDVPITKTWMGTPASSITVQLYNGSAPVGDPVDLSANTSGVTVNGSVWSYTFSGEPKYVSSSDPLTEINYTVQETKIGNDTVVNNGVAISGTYTVGGVAESVTVGNWAVTYSSDPLGITNTYTPTNYSTTVDDTPASFSIHKVDDQGALIATSSATFGLFSDSACQTAVMDASNNPRTFTTVDGIAMVGNLFGNSDESTATYYLKETNPPAGYQASSTVWTVNVSQGDVSVTGPVGTVFTRVWNWVASVFTGSDSANDQLSNGVLTVYNTPIDYSLTITKTVSGISGSGDYQFNVYKMGESGNYSTTPANASPISVTAGSSITLTTAHYGWLTAGGYKVEEVDANVSSGSYDLSTTYCVNSSSGNVVTLTDAASSGTVTCTNDYSLKTGDLTITKNVAGTTTTDSFAITVTIGSSPYSGNYTVGSTSYSTTGGVISLSNGQTATISGLSYGTSYSVAETGANASGYNVSYTVNGAAGFSGTIGASNSVIVTNAYVTSGFLIYKENSGNTLLSGSEFTLYTAYSAGAETPYDNGVNGVYADTDSDGQIAVSNLPAGEYWLKETKAPADYELSSTVWHITVTSGTNATVTVETATEVGTNRSIISKLLNAVITFVTGKDDKDYNVIADNGNVVLTVVDAPIDYSLTIEKAISGVNGTTGTYYFDIYGQGQSGEYTNLLQVNVPVAVENGVCTPVTLHTLGTNGYSWLKAGSYKIMEDTAASGGIGNYSLTGTTYQTGAASASLTSADIVALSDSAAAAYAKVTNTYARDTGTLEITKVVTGLQGTAASQDHTFTFTVANSENTATYTVTINGNGNVTTNGNSSNSSISLPTGTYTVTESDASLQYHNGPTVGYSVGGQEAHQVTIAKDTQSTITVTNAYVYNPGTTEQSITVNKAWEDDSNRDGIRPNSVTVELWDSSEISRKIDTKVIQTASTGNTASGTFTFDPYVNGYVGPYHVVETGYTLFDNTFVPITSDTPYTASYLSTADNELMTDGTVVGNAITITNTHQPEEINRIPVVKTWSGSVGSSIELALYQGEEDTGLRLNMTADTDGTSDTQFVSADGHTWIGTFRSYRDIQPTLARLSIAAPSPLYKYAGGELINYNVKEIQLNGTDLTGNTLGFWTITTGQSTAGIVLPESWATEQEYDSDAMALTVTNTYTQPYNPPSTNYTLTVQWVDENGTALATPVSSTISEGGSYNAANVSGGSGRTFTDYTYNGLAAGSDAISGTMNGNKTVIFTYTGTAVIPPENPPLNETPGTEIPETEIPETEIPEGTVPLAEAPKTGDELVLWILAAAASGTGLIWLAISRKKRKDDGMNG